MSSYKQFSSYGSTSASVNVNANQADILAHDRVVKHGPYMLDLHVDHLHSTKSPEMAQSDSEANLSLREEVVELENAARTDASAEAAEKSRATVHIPDDESTAFSFKKLWAFSGPGFLMSIAYLDPGNIESDLSAGATAGYSLIWVLWWSTIMGLALQILAARLGVVTGKNLAQVCRDHYSRPARYALWAMTELAIIGSDIQEVVGSAIAIRILSKQAIPLWGGVLITAADTFTFLFLEGYGLRKLELVFAILIAIMVGAFGYMYGESTASQVDVLKGLAVPSIPSGTLEQAVSLVGAVIMPHNIFLHSALVQSRQIDRSKEKKVTEANMYYRIESTIALVLSFVINVMVVGVFASLVASGSDGNCGSDIDLFSAGNCLAQQYGDTFLYIWAVGLLAAGQSSTMTGTYAGQFVMNGFLKLDIKPWKRVLLTRSIAIIPAVSVAAVAHNGDGSLSSLGEWLNILQSIQLPFALLPILIFTSSERVMGSWRNGRILQSVCWAIGFLVLGMNVYLIIDFVQTSFPDLIELYVLVGVLGAAYMIFICYLMKDSVWYIWLVSKLFNRQIHSNLYETSQAGQPSDKTKLLGAAY
ncbi:ferrous ion membrane transporter DMT1 [Capsaspora owczarzaki ATCC 30864]|uniref:Ferrous ion membrane transporter DMT1 n=1 Tax=Capsaspora owczarzaki (strain ATCC 30864) TaxID=595528 RepID=A0A0D2VTV1_CAPO3|nr:ferrous ion membrane transporter DMT1 [Capsaspora owczarzaki ATCC 30864]KJE94747.1 ferrous ion membrane transporter DMT1 [Capsaspora owczarzaki ATCC 30864]|eukprot:XP_004347021.1 ferrous ion membrane transporter DMT1 [Capsaspora owczarzaki ATCC 30864]